MLPDRVDPVGVAMSLVRLSDAHSCLAAELLGLHLLDTRFRAYSEEDAASSTAVCSRLGGTGILKRKKKVDTSKCVCRRIVGNYLLSSPPFGSNSEDVLVNEAKDRRCNALYNVLRVRRTATGNEDGATYRRQNLQNQSS